MQRINLNTGELAIGDKTYDLSHLTPFADDIPNIGPNGSTIRVRVTFTSHVISKAVPSESNKVDFLDEGNRSRVFCPTRFEQSKSLREICSQAMITNIRTWQSADRNGRSNLAAVPSEHTDDEHYLIVFQLHPSRASGLDIEMKIKSAYMKRIQFSKAGMHIQKIHSNIKTCYYKNKSVP